MRISDWSSDVCSSDLVSWEDANAYARWLAQRSDHAYRLPHARESAMLPAAKSERQVSSWNSDCSGNCSRRIGSGPSWRGDAGTRPLDAARERQRGGQGKRGAVRVDTGGGRIIKKKK